MLSYFILFSCQCSNDRVFSRQSGLPDLNRIELFFVFSLNGAIREDIKLTGIGQTTSLHRQAPSTTWQARAARSTNNEGGGRKCGRQKSASGFCLAAWRRQAGGACRHEGSRFRGVCKRPRPIVATAAAGQRPQIRKRSLFWRGGWRPAMQVARGVTAGAAPLPRDGVT